MGNGDAPTKIRLDMQFHIGTSGYGYKEWKGKFYPERIKPEDMLPFYAGRFDAVEINNTFYRMPQSTLLAGWAAQVPPAFRFALKAPQRITHLHRLVDAEVPLARFLEVTRSLGRHRGPVLFQLPPSLKADVGRLAAFLELLPTNVQAAFELRHASWLSDTVFETLRRHRAAFCTADTEEGTGPLAATAEWGYLRLRRLDYDDNALRAWTERIAAQPWREAYVFFKHEDEAKGPEFAARFKVLASTPSSE